MDADHHFYPEEKSIHRLTPINAAYDEKDHHHFFLISENQRNQWIIVLFA
jgi:hypothetical protein